MDKNIRKSIIIGIILAILVFPIVYVLNPEHFNITPGNGFMTVFQYLYHLLMFSFSVVIVSGFIGYLLSLKYYKFFAYSVAVILAFLLLLYYFYMTDVLNIGCSSGTGCPLDLIISIVSLFLAFSILILLAQIAVKHKMKGKSWRVNLLVAIIVSLVMGGFSMAGFGYAAFFVAPIFILFYLIILLYYIVLSFKPKKTKHKEKVPIA